MALNSTRLLVFVTHLVGGDVGLCNRVSVVLSGRNNMVFCVSASCCTWPIGEWDVVRVTDMSAIFMGTIIFNSNISKWDVSRVRDMSHMFVYVTQFNTYINKCTHKTSEHTKHKTDLENTQFALLHFAEFQRLREVAHARALAASGLVSMQIFRLRVYQAKH